MTPGELLTRIEGRRAPYVLDVRSHAEFVRGHVPGAHHVPFWWVVVRPYSVAAPREDVVVVYCGHGPRAWLAGAVLRRIGFRDVQYLDGHMSGWRRARLLEHRS